MAAAWQQLSTALAARVEPPGFEVFGATGVGAYNRTLAPHRDGYRLPQLAGDATLVLVVGNTRRLWPLFLAAYRTTALGREPDPLDAYTRLHLERAVAAVAAQHGLAHATRYSFEPPPNAVAIQRLAQLAGVAELSDVGLSAHPVHGPWFSLRAAVMFATTGPEPSRPPPSCSACAGKPCLRARAAVEAETGGPLTAQSFLAHGERWQAIRKACPLGADARYGEQQLRYHYSKRLEILRE